MKTRTIILTSVLFGALAVHPSSAQSLPPAASVVCTTSDGPVLISPTMVRLRDYRLTFLEEREAGVREYADALAGISAEVDTREGAGVYVTVRDAGVTMQIVAAREDIRPAGSRDGSTPESPLDSAIGEVVPQRPR